MEKEEEVWKDVILVKGRQNGGVPLSSSVFPKTG